MIRDQLDRRTGDEQVRKVLELPVITHAQGLPCWAQKMERHETRGQMGK